MTGSSLKMRNTAGAAAKCGSRAVTSIPRDPDDATSRLPLEQYSQQPHSSRLPFQTSRCCLVHPSSIASHPLAASPATTWSASP